MSVAPLNSVFGEEPVNYFGASFINRLSFLRSNYDFLHQAIIHPCTKFLVCDRLTPPISKIKVQTDTIGADDDKKKQLPPFATRPALNKLEYLKYKDVKDFIGEPYKVPEEKQIKAWDSSKNATGIGKPIIVFLGIEEIKNTNHSDKLFTFSQPGSGTYQGIPYFAVDISESYLKSENLLNASKAIKKDSPVSAFFGKGPFNPFAVRLSADESGLFAQARQYIDWNSRNRYCAGCGLPVMSINGGTKLLCPETDKGIPKTEKCETRGTISNLQFPRTDTSIISAVINYDGDKMLLGRGKRFPPGVFSCLAGFLEPAETIEDCVRREVWEESGVTVGRVVTYSTQPWPFPANIMVGCIAQVTDPSENAHKIHLGHDPELADAQWFSFDTLREVLNSSESEKKSAMEKGELGLPPPEAIGWILINAVVNGRIKGLVRSKI